jgi:hypothetical protein
VSRPLLERVEKTGDSVESLETHQTQQIVNKLATLANGPNWQQQGPCRLPQVSRQSLLVLPLFPGPIGRFTVFWRQCRRRSLSRNCFQFSLSQVPEYSQFSFNQVPALLVTTVQVDLSVCCTEQSKHFLEGRIGCVVPQSFAHCVEWRCLRP